MKFLTSLLILACMIPGLAFGFANGQVQQTNYGPTLTRLIEASTFNGEHVLRYIKGFWDTSVNSGFTTGTVNLTTNARGYPNPIIQLPANAAITQSYFYVKTQALGQKSGVSTFSVTCGNATLFTSADISGKQTGTYFAGNQTGTAATMSDVGTSPCTPQVVIGGTAYGTSGQIDVYIDFTTHD